MFLSSIKFSRVFSAKADFLLNNSIKYRNSIKNFYCNHAIKGTFGILHGTLDQHKGLVIDSRSNECQNISSFKNILEASLKQWQEEKVRSVWFNIAVPHVEWIPILKENGFQIHRASDDTIYLCRWLAKDEASKIPSYAHNMIGAGAVVMNDDGEILVIRERIYSRSIWKLPGGLIDPGEDIVKGAMREVLEETGIQTEFISVYGIRYSQKTVFGCSDMYFILRLRPLSFEIHKQDEEVEDCQWMNIDEFMSHIDWYPSLKNFLKEALESEKSGIAMERSTAVHPITKNPQMLYTISKVPKKQ